jgi:hypothetical protein
MIHLFLILALQDPSTWNEVQWSAFIAAEIGGKTEVRTPDGSRADIVANGIAWEVEFCTKKYPYKHWASPAQATFYAAALNLKPGVILLFDGSQIAQESYLKCLVVCTKYGIKLETRRINP